MILRINEQEVATVVLHMAIMRKNVRNGFKRNYKEQAKEMIASFDEVKKDMEKALEQFSIVSLDEIDLHFNKREIDMLEGFLGFYVPEVEKLQNSLTEHDIEQLWHMKGIQEKLEGLRVSYA